MRFSRADRPTAELGIFGPMRAIGHRVHYMLLVDDSPEVLNVTACLLETCGREVATADSGAQCFAIGLRGMSRSRCCSAARSIISICLDAKPSLLDGGSLPTWSVELERRGAAPNNVGGSP
jgi:hypothetical protein